MNKNQKARLGRHAKVDAVLTDFQDAIDKLPGTLSVVQQYRKLAGPLLPARQQQRPSSEGITTTKADTETDLIGYLVRAASGLYLVLRALNTPESRAAADNLHRRRSDYTAFDDQELQTESTAVYNLALDHAAALATFNFTADDLSALGTLVGANETQAPLPKLAIENTKIGGQNFRAALRTLDDYLKDDLRAAIDPLEKSHADLFQRFHQARRIDDPAYHARKAKRAQKGETDGGMSAGN